MNQEVTYGLLQAHPGVHIRDRKICFLQEQVVIELLVTDLIRAPDREVLANREESSNRVVARMNLLYF